MKVFTQYVLFLAAFAAIVATVTYRSVVDGSVASGPPWSDESAQPTDISFPIQVSLPASQDGPSAPREGEAPAEPLFQTRAPLPEPDPEIVGDILRIRARLRAATTGGSPAVDTGTPAEFAASLRDVIANRSAESEPAPTRLTGPIESLPDRSPPPPDLPPSLPVYPPITVGPRLGIPQPGPPLRSTYAVPSLPAPSFAPAVATVNSRADVVVSLRQIGRQFDLLAADLEDQRQFDDAESLRTLVQTIRAEARRLEEELVP